MAKILCNYFGLSMAAEGKSEFVGRQAAAFLGYVQQDAERCAENCGCAEDLSDAPEKIKREILRNDEELRRREQTAPGVEHDVVAIYDNAGIPSIMHRFRRVTNKELFGGSDAVHPAFIIGGEVYDEIYISVYENTMINGKPYSLPLQEPVTNITMEDFAQACFSKGEGWHCLTAAEWGLLRDALAALPAQRLGEIRQKMLALAAAQPSFPVVCPLLDPASGACPVYAARPVACRTYGFYVQRELGLYCRDIESQVADGALADVVWGNHDAIDRRLAELGEARPLNAWFESWASRQ